MTNNYNNGNVRILVVDDESSIRELIKEYLSIEGYQVDTASDGNNAYEYMRHSYYDIIITDLEMPGLNGIELLEKANKEGLNHKFIILTGFGTVETAITALKLGALDYILKPFKLEEFGLIIKNAIRRRKLEEENIQLKEALSLYQISEAMILNDNVRAVLDLVLEKVLTEFDSDISIIALKEVDIFSRKEKIYSPVITKISRSTMEVSQEELESGFNKDIVYRVLEKDRILNLTGKDINKIRNDKPLSFEIKSYLGVAIGLRDRFYGSLCVFRIKNGIPFTHAQEKLLAIFAERVTSLLEVKRYDEGLQITMIESIESLVKALEAKEPYTRGHSERVSAYAVILAEKIGFDEKLSSRIALAGRLHDIGKIGIRYDALTKKEGLDKEEYEQFKLHTIIGANILKPMSFLSDIIPYILYHHERYDGRGYPEGLKGDHIPFVARILSICDSFDVMTSDRPYRDALNKEDVISELKNNSGTQFDPELVNTMLQLLEEGKIPLVM
ncbi:MAG: response regulator [Deltaproteobacteria bacterium]|nr:response regulator [Deltaproteobacteria bacterium]MCL5792446.1 response regulator [Deltaproteobacteria bacterium]